MDLVFSEEMWGKLGTSMSWERAMVLIGVEDGVVADVVDGDQSCT